MIEDFEGMTTPAEWIEMAWAARNAALASKNLERRGWFEGVKSLLLERDMPKSILHPAIAITRLAVRAQK